MHLRYFVSLSLAAAMAITIAAGCDNDERSSESAPTASSKPAEAKKNATPSGKPSTFAPPPVDAPASESSTLSLEGLTMTVPDGWVAMPATGGAMGPKAVFSITSVKFPEVQCTVRITYFPGMKGMDDANIDRWLAQVRSADGSPSTRDDAKITRSELGNVRLTMVDVTGAVSQSMTGHGANKSGQRLIATIVDHPSGPHFVKVSGPADAMADAVEGIETFLKSAKVR